MNSILSEGKKHAPLFSILILVFTLMVLGHAWKLHQGGLTMTEGVRALTGHQTLQEGNWLVPKLYGSVYLTKPPLFYWIEAGAEKITGQANEWVWRLPAVLAAAFSATFISFMLFRWAGSVAALAGGLSFLFLLVLGTQNRSAEIDAVNNTLSVICALSLIEIGFGAPRRKWLWACISGLALGGALLAKGPAGLPIIGGALLGPPLVMRRAGVLKSGWLWFVIAIGALLFGSWAWQVHQWTAVHLVTADTSGISEFMQRLNPTRWIREAPEIAVLPVLVFAYSLPISLAWIFNWGLAQSDVEKAIHGTIIGALVLCVLSSMTNPRYAYMIPPLFCLQAGFLARNLHLGILPDHRIKWLKKSANFFSLVIVIGLLAFLVILYKDQQGTIPPACAIAGLIAAPAGFLLLQQIHRAKWRRCGVLAVTLCMCFLIVFSEWFVLKREKDSGRVAGLDLQKVIHPETHVFTDQMARFHPEIFYYANTTVTRFDTMAESSFHPPESGWYVLHPFEWDAWTEDIRSQFTEVQRLPPPDEAFIGHWQAP